MVVVVKRGSGAKTGEGRDKSVGEFGEKWGTWPGPLVGAKHSDSELPNTPV